MEEIHQEPNWVTQLKELVLVSQDNDKRQAAIILLKVLSIELRRVERIRQLTYRLLLDYKFASSPILKWRVFLWQR